VIVDVGFFRDEVNTAIPNVDLTNGQQHVVSVRRYNRGRRLVLAVRSAISNKLFSINGAVFNIKPAFDREGHRD